MKVKALVNGQYTEIEMEEQQSETEVQNSAAAMKRFFETLANSETNSIAKIRAAASEFLSATGEVKEDE